MITPRDGDWEPVMAELAAGLGRAPASILYLSRNDLEPSYGLEERFPGAVITRWTKADFQGQRALGVLKKLRRGRYDLFVFHDRPVLLDRLTDLYSLVALGVRARRRFLLAADVNRGRRQGPWSFHEVRSAAALPGLAARLTAEVATSVPLLLATPPLLSLNPPRPIPARFEGRRAYSIAYLRTDLSLGVTIGGSVSHTSGVTGGLLAAGHRVRFLAPGPVPDLDEARTPVLSIPPGNTVRVFDEAAMVDYHHRFNARALPVLRRERPDFIYQRHSVFNASGAVLARKLGVPLLLEANGSEVWARAQWSRLQLRRLAERMERYAFEGAAAIVVVSTILKEQLVGLGADAARILVNPNGVDPDRFHPGVDGTAVRAAHGWGPDQVVCGFLGTFTRWHGVLFLAEQAGELLRRHPNARFLFMGDGDLRSAVEDRIRAVGAGPATAFTGLIGHDAVPAHLAACDVLVSPHLPFEDGTPFFGSPTKLFEYLAMGRAVVASHLGQIGEVVEEGRSGLLYEPGDAAAFVRQMGRLLGDGELRARLGAGARRRVLAHYTWRRNADRAVGFLEERLGVRPGATPATAIASEGGHA